MDQVVYNTNFLKGSRYSLVRGVVFFTLLIFANQVLATTPDTTQNIQLGTKIHLDDATMSRGYTITHEDMSVGIQPNTFTEAAGVWVHQKQTYPDLPEYLEVVSSVYVYQIDVTEQAYVSQPIWLSYSYAADPEHRRSLYYYDGRLNEWVPLPTSLDTVNNHVRAAWHFPYSIIVVADDTRYGLGPIQRDTYAAFGDIAAESAIAIDEATGEELYGKNVDTKRSIASLTKLMTAYVLLENEVDLDAVVTYHSRYDQIGARLYVNEGETMTMRDLMYAMTIGSANNAAYALIDNAGYSTSEFVQMMNNAASELELTNTTFADPSGLDPANQSTAADYASFVRQVSRDPDILALTTAQAYAFTTLNTGQYHDFNNTNLLMRTSDLYITASKTGYLDEALYCLAMKAKDGDREVITVVLGAPTSWGRFTDSERLMDWAFTNYEW